MHLDDGSKNRIALRFEEKLGVDVSHDPDWFPLAVCRGCKDGLYAKGEMKKEIADWDVSTPEKEAELRERLNAISSRHLGDLKKERLRKNAERLREMTAKRLQEREEAEEAAANAELPGTFSITKSDNPSKYLIANEETMEEKNIVNLRSMDENTPIENNPIDKYLLDGQAKMLHQFTLGAGGKILRINGQYVLIEAEIEVFNLNEIAELEDSSSLPSSVPPVQDEQNNNETTNPDPPDDDTTSELAAYRAQRRRCKFCQKTCRVLDLAQHEATHVELAPSISCDKCDRKFNTQKRLRKHQNSHITDHCDKCNKDIKRNSFAQHYCSGDPELAEERRRKAAEEWKKRKPRRLAGVAVVKCEVCQREFANRWKLTDHRRGRMLENDLGYKCCECEIVLEGEDFAQHLLLHVGGG